MFMDKELKALYLLQKPLFAHVAPHFLCVVFAPLNPAQLRKFYLLGFVSLNPTYTTVFAVDVEVDESFVVHGLIIRAL